MQKIGSGSNCESDSIQRRDLIMLYRDAEVTSSKYVLNIFLNSHYKLKKARKSNRNQTYWMVEKELDIQNDLRL